MPYNKAIEDRIDHLIADWQNIEKKKMFGGICYLTNGNMCFGIWQEYLIVRMNPEAAGEKLRLPHVHPFAVTGKPMKGWLMVAEEGWRSEEELRDWLAIGRDFALTLPAK
jgi:TfoX/Sxy family transcriptional regulator of competence genes